MADKRRISRDIETFTDTSVETRSNDSYNKGDSKINDEVHFYDMGDGGTDDLSKKKHLNQRRLGNMFAFFYRNGEPLFVVGPHCINCI
jgi:hypothetical protein